MQWADLGPALGLSRQELVSFVGGGGKTSAVFALAEHRSGRRIVTTTTKMGRERTGGLPVLLNPSDQDIAAGFETNPALLVWGAVDEHRAVGVSTADCDRWMHLADTVAVEADGSRRRPFKAPAAYEPVIPAATTTLVACVGLAAVNAPIAEGCHRPELVAGLLGCDEADRLTAERLVTVLLSDQGSRRECPDHARFAVLLNRCTPERQTLADEVRERIATADPAVTTVVIDEMPPG